MDDTIKIQSLFEILNPFIAIKPAIRINNTTPICANSTPKANSSIGNSLLSESINTIFKNPDKPKPCINPKKKAKNRLIFD